MGGRHARDSRVGGQGEEVLWTLLSGGCFLWRCLLGNACFGRAAFPGRETMRRADRLFIFGVSFGKKTASLPCSCLSPQTQPDATAAQGRRAPRESTRAFGHVGLPSGSRAFAPHPGEHDRRTHASMHVACRADRRHSSLLRVRAATRACGDCGSLCGDRDGWRHRAARMGRYQSFARLHGRPRYTQHLCQGECAAPAWPSRRVADRS